MDSYHNWNQKADIKYLEYGGISERETVKRSLKTRDKNKFIDQDWPNQPFKLLYEMPTNNKIDMLRSLRKLFLYHKNKPSKSESLRLWLILSLWKGTIVYESLKRM